MPDSIMVAQPDRLATGWAQVFTLSATEVTSWGILYYAFPVFLAPMQRELHWPLAALTGAYSLALLVAGLGAIPVGLWLDRRRTPRWLMTAGSLLAVLGVGAWALVGNLSAFYAIWLVLGLAMAATLYEPAFAAVIAWFPRRERALTVLTTIGGLASVIYLPLAAVLVQQLGWRQALLVLGIILAVSTLMPHALLLRPFPPAPRLEPASALPQPSAWRTWDFWQLILAFVLAQIAIAAVFVHLVPYLILHGTTVTLAATATGLIGGVSLLGRMVATWRSTAHTRATMTAVILLLQAVGIAILLLGQGIVAIMAFVLLFGAGFGVISPARAGLVADRFGTVAFGRLNGQVALAVTLARAVAPAGASLLLLAWGSYVPVFWTLAALSLAGAGVLLIPHRQLRILP